MYVESLDSLVQWFFALDHVNYARWIPIHIRDMESLPDSIAEEFKKYWVLQKTQNCFSCMPLDQAHEQNNKLVKDSGGAVGLTENPIAFRRWMVGGPEQARLLKEFERQLSGYTDEEGNLPHHEQYASVQELFKKHVCDLCATISSMGNPFLDDCPELLVLNTRNCASDEVIETIKNIKDLGLSQYKEYVDGVIVSRDISIHQLIKKKSLPLFKRQALKGSKTKKQISSLKSDCNRFSHLYIASTFRGGDLEEFFSHENHPWPPSISDHGKLRLPTQKSDLLVLLEGVTSGPPSHFDIKLIDGSAAVHFLSCASVSTFVEYSLSVFNTYVKNELLNCGRIDIIWDVYKADSLKVCTREKRGKGIRKKVSGHVKLPCNFQDFLRDTKNKQELFEFLTSNVLSSDIESDKVICVTSGMYCMNIQSAVPIFFFFFPGSSVISVNYSSQDFQSCDHEEADTRIALHLYDVVIIKVPQIFSCALLILMSSLSLLVCFFIFIHQLTSGLRLAQGRILDIIALTIFAKYWGKRSQGQYLSFMLSLGATPHHSFMERQKNLRGKLGNHFHKQPWHLHIFCMSHFSH